MVLCPFLGFISCFLLRVMVLARSAMRISVYTYVKVQLRMPGYAPSVYNC